MMNPRFSLALVASLSQPAPTPAHGFDSRDEGYAGLFPVEGQVLFSQLDPSLPISDTPFYFEDASATLAGMPNFTPLNDPSAQAAKNRGITMQEYDLAIPILPSRSLIASGEFYKRLGFEGGVHEFNQDYAIMRRGAIELHFFTHRELVPAESFAGCYIRVLDVENLYTSALLCQLPRKGIPRMDVLEDKPWGLREFAIVDPDGNLVRIGQLSQTC